MLKNCSLGFLLAGLLLSSTQAGANSVFYGDFEDLANGGTVIYRDVSEDSITDPVPLFGAPTISVNALDFNPVSFGATASNGGVDVTDATLSFGIDAVSGNTLDIILLEERGDIQLTGLGTSSTLAQVSMNVFVDVVELDGTPVNINLGPGGTTDPFQMVFTPDGGSYNLEQNPGPIFSDSFNGLLEIDLDEELAAAGVSGSATKIKINLDNKLIALSEDGTSSFIKKKDIDGLTVTAASPVPEPSAAALFGIGVLVTVRSLRRQRAA